VSFPSFTPEPLEPVPGIPEELRRLLPPDQLKRLEEQQAAVARYNDAAYAAALEYRRAHVRWPMLFCRCHKWPGQCGSDNPVPQHNCLLHGALFFDDKGNPVF
jgi:hypothetical protein